MTNSNIQNSNSKSDRAVQNKPFFIPFLINLMTLLSIGFIAGSIVHIGFNNANNAYYIAFGILGCLLFVLGNYLQEKIIKKNPMLGLQTFSFLIITLLLSIAVGMISGGLQHFMDFPKYATYLIPLGIFFSVLFYLIKNDYKPFSKYIPLLLGTLVLSGVVFVGANQLASNVKPLDHHAETKASTSNSNSMIVDHDMGNMVFNNQNFIENMIPHHQEAINTSYIIQATTQDSELKTFVNNVIIAQSKEVTQMRDWYRQWFGKDYTDNKDYMPMMTKMNGLSGKELDKVYIEGMIGHHKGAVQMAEKILRTPEIKPEIKSLSQNIITDQNKEIELLNGWLKSKFNVDPSKSEAGKAITEGKDGCPAGQSKQVMPSMCMSDPELQPHNDGHEGH